MALTAYWIEFDAKQRDALPVGALLGCGVTAESYTDAINLVQQKLFGGGTVPQISKCIENVDISTLDSGHVRPNMGSPLKRGIWFPLGFE
jgi:hypothetical protein